MQTTYLDQDDRESQFLQLDTSPQQQVPLCPDFDTMNYVYSPWQPFLKKNISNVSFEQLDAVAKRKGTSISDEEDCGNRKKICIDRMTSSDTSLNQNSTASNTDLENSEHETFQPENSYLFMAPHGEGCYSEDDLERLVHKIGLESIKEASQRIPTKEDIDQLWQTMSPTYSSSSQQESFLSTYLSKDQILKIKNGIDEDILKGEETVNFQNWVEDLCNNDNVKAMKEMARKSKVSRYLEKKYGRTYFKKVHYQIRQKVAEERLRVKGRFVTWTQALNMLNESKDTKKQWNVKDYYSIKTKLSEKFGSNKLKI